MHSIQTIRRSSLLFSTLLVSVLLTLVLAACGTNSGTTAGTGSSPSPTATASGLNSSNGCPSNVVVSTPPPAANVTVKVNEANSTVTAQNGDVIQIELPFGHVWSGPVTSQGMLELQPPAGYASTATSMCIWRFTAKGTGTTQLSFTSRALCKNGQMCPQYIIVVPFTITVK
jgi:hypothetical protein